MAETKRLTWQELRDTGVRAVDEAVATQTVVVLTRRTTDIAVIVPVARYSAMMKKIREGGEK